MQERPRWKGVEFRSTIWHYDMDGGFGEVNMALCFVAVQGQTCIVLAYIRVRAYPLPACSRNLSNLPV